MLYLPDGCSNARKQETLRLLFPRRLANAAAWAKSDYAPAVEVALVQPEFGRSKRHLREERVDANELMRVCQACEGKVLFDTVGALLYHLNHAFGGIWGFWW